MTTLAIIGAGIAGRSLLWALAKEKKNVSQITIFDAESFIPSCSISSTATVGLRGITPGHSPLGDTLYEGFQCFKKHFLEDAPKGVYPVSQFSAAFLDQEKFLKRFSQSRPATGFLDYKFQNEVLLNEEDSFMIEPKVYLSWLINHADINFKLVHALVKEVKRSPDGYELLDSEGIKYNFDKVVYCSGAFQKSFNTELKTKIVQGSFFELEKDLGSQAFSLTIDGVNLVYHAHRKILLIGSTSSEYDHFIPPHNDLSQLYDKLQNLLDFRLPLKDFNQVRVGLREKASKRAPYLLQREHEYFIGGFYKNGFSLALHMAEKLITRL